MKKNDVKGKINVKITMKLENIKYEKSRTTLRSNTKYKKL